MIGSVNCAFNAAAESALGSAIEYAADAPSHALRFARGSMWAHVDRESMYMLFAANCAKFPASYPKTIVTNSVARLKVSICG